MITPSTASGFTTLVSSAGKPLVAPHPETGNASDIANARRCPVLVRAALIASCPAVNTAPNAVHYTVTDQPTNESRCPVADHIRVHVRTEQVFQIAGTAPLAPVDTIVDNKDASSISLDKIIRQKNGGTCLPGMVSGTGGCHY